MQIFVGLIIAFFLGYLTSQYGLFGSVIEEFVDVTLSSNKVIDLQLSKAPLLYPTLLIPYPWQRGIILVVAGLILSYIFILIPLERIASIESKRVGYVVYMVG